MTVIYTERWTIITLTNYITAQETLCSFFLLGLTLIFCLRKQHLPLLRLRSNNGSLVDTSTSCKSSSSALIERRHTLVTCYVSYVV